MKDGILHPVLLSSHKVPGILSVDSDDAISSPHFSLIPFHDIKAVAPQS